MVDVIFIYLEIKRLGFDRVEVTLCVNGKQIVCNEEKGVFAAVCGYFQPFERLHGEQQQFHTEVKVVQGHDTRANAVIQYTV